MTADPRGAAGRGRGGPRGPIDRHRRQRIIDGALRVITDLGVASLTHRRVATAAGVPVSATTYYFNSLDELLDQTFAAAVERDRLRVETYLQALPPTDSPVERIANLTLWMIDDRDSGILALELCVAALRSDRLRQLAQAWDDGWRELLQPYVGASKARVVAALMTGLIIRESMAVDRATPDEIRATLREALVPSAPPDPPMH